LAFLREQFLKRTVCFCIKLIYEQPIVYELKDITIPTLLIVGEADRKFIGKNLVRKEEQILCGNFPLLAKKAKEQIKNCTLIELSGVGHIPHIQDPALFNKYL